MVEPRSRRKSSKDPLLKLLTWLNGAAGILLFASICFLALAKPENRSFFDHYFNVNVYRRAHWNMNLVDYIAISLALCGLTSVAGLLINSKRLKRRGDFVRATLVLCLVLSIVGLGIYFYYT